MGSLQVILESEFFPHLALPHVMKTEKRTDMATRALLDWYQALGRHELPWRRKPDSYAVLISEFMLQQTTVATVIPRFTEWMNRFPDLQTLAMATEEEVLSAWQGLGYYSRARRLHSSSKAIMQQYGGTIPKDEERLLSLPGFGSYTAAAVRAFAYDLHAIVLDTNITRVLARWANLSSAIDTAEGISSIRKIAQAFYPESGCRAMASAMMDLGSMVCISGKPRCSECPLQSTCQAGEPSLLPYKSPRAVTLRRSENRLWFYHDSLLYLEQSQGPLWRGLWILPELGGMKASGRPLAKITYPITRYRVTMTIHTTVQPPPPNLKGFTIEEMAATPIPSPHRRGIEMIFKNLK